MSFQVSILVNVTKPTRKVILHALNLYFYKSFTSVQEVNGSSNSTSVPLKQQYYQEKDDFYILELTRDLLAGKQYKVNLKWSARMEDNFAGLYRSYYFENSQTK